MIMTAVILYRIDVHLNRKSIIIHQRFGHFCGWAALHDALIFAPGVKIIEHFKHFIRPKFVIRCWNSESCCGIHALSARVGQKQLGGGGSSAESGRIEARALCGVGRGSFSIPCTVGGGGAVPCSYKILNFWSLKGVAYFCKLLSAFVIYNHAKAVKNPYAWVYGMHSV